MYVCVSLSLYIYIYPCGLLERVVGRVRRKVLRNTIMIIITITINIMNIIIVMI